MKESGNHKRRHDTEAVTVRTVRFSFFFFIHLQGTGVVTRYDHKLDAKRRHWSSLPIQSVAWKTVTGTKYEDWVEN